MSNTKISIEIKDRIADGIAPKLKAIGVAAAGAAPGLQAFKTVWKGFDFTGMAGLGLGRVNNQLKAVKKSTYDLRRSSEQLLTSQLRTKNTSAQYEKTLNSLTLQKQRLQKAGLGAEAAENSLAASQFKLRGILTATVDVTTKLTDSQIKQAKKANLLQLSNDRVAVSYLKRQKEVVKLAREEQKLIVDQNNARKSAVQLQTAEKGLARTGVALERSTASLKNQLLDLSVKEEKLIKDGNRLAVTQAKLAAQTAAMGQSSTVTARLTSNLSKEEIKRQKELNGLRRSQDRTAISANKLILSNIQVRKATANAVIEEQKAVKATNQAAKSAIAKQKALQSLNRTTDAYNAKTTAATGRTVSFSRALTRSRAAAFASRGAVSGLVTSLRSYLSLGALVGAGGALKGIDSFKRIQNQIKGTTTNTAQLEAVTDELFGVAQRARVPISDLTIAYRRYDNALSKVGMGQKDSLRITETIGKMLSLNGASATESASALLQLSQAFNKGKLDGDEFRSVAELMPQILDAIAKATGKSRSELFKMSKDGEITVGVLIKAFQSLEKPIDKLMQNASRTIGQSFTQLVNKLIYLFGQWDKKTKFTEKLAAVLDSIGNNLDYILKTIRSVGAALVGSGAASAIGAFFTLIISGVGNLALLPGIIGLITARLVYLGDQIKFTFGKGMFGEDLTITLTEVINNAMFNFERLFKFASGLAEAFFQVLIPKNTAQDLANVFLEILSIVKDIMTVVTGIIAGIGRAISNLVSGIHGADKQTGALEDRFESSLGKAGSRIANLLMELPTYFTVQILKLGNAITTHLAPVIATIMFEITRGMNELKWFIQNPLGVLMGKKYEDPFTMRDVGPQPRKLSMEEMAIKLNDDMRFGVGTGDFGKSYPTFGFTGPKPKKAVTQVESEIKKIMDEVAKDFPSSRFKLEDQMAVFNMRMLKNQKGRMLIEQKLEQEHAKEMTKWKEKVAAEESRVNELRLRKISTTAASIRDSASRVNKSLNLVQWETAPTVSNFFNDILKGMSEFKTKSDNLFKGLVSGIQQSAIVGFSNLKLPAVLESEVQSLALGIKLLTNGFKNLGQTAIPILEILSDKINNPLLKSGLNFLIDTLKNGAEAVNNISSKLREGIKLPPSSGLNTGLGEMTEQASALQTIFGNLSNAFQNFVKTGKLSFKELMRSILADLLKLFMNNLFKQLFGGMMGGGGGGGFLSGLLGGGMAGGGSVPIAGGNGSTRTLLPSGFG